MASIIEPLAKKVELFNKDIARILDGLVKGDPAAIERVHELTSGIAKLYQDCKSILNQTNATAASALKTYAILPPPGGQVTISSLRAALEEVQPALNLVTSVIRLIANLASVSTLLQLTISELSKAYGYLNLPGVWLNKAVERTKQQLSKEIEWKRRDIAARSNILYLTSQQKQYTGVLKQIEAKLPPKPAPQMGINGYYSGGTFIYFNDDQPFTMKPLNTTISSNSQNTAVNSVSSSTIDTKVTESQINNVSIRLKDITVQLEKEKLEIKPEIGGIAKDKIYWKKKWKEEEKADAELLKGIKKSFLV
jgi:hypothetical protein